MHIKVRSHIFALSVLTATLAIVLVHSARADVEVGVISGRVFDSETFLPLSGAMVVLDGNDTLWMSGHSGDYAIPNVPLGIHRVRAFIEGYLANSHEVNLSGPSTTLDIYLDPVDQPVNGVIKGVIGLERTYGDMDVDDASVVVRALDRTGGDEIVLDVVGSGLSGEFMSTLSPGNWSVQGMAYGHVPSTPLNVLVLPGRAVDVDLMLRSTGALVTLLEGTVRSSGVGTPLKGATVVARSSGSGAVYTCPTGSMGDYFFADVPLGSYTVIAFASGHHSGIGTVDVESGDPTVLDILLSPLGAGSDGTSLVWGIVTLDGSPSKDAWAIQPDGRNVRTNEFGMDGLYSFNGLHSGRSSVSVWAPDSYPSTVPIDIPSGSVLRQDIALFRMTNGSAGSSLVLFKVNDGSPMQTPLGGTDVTLYKTDPSSGIVERFKTMQMPPDGSAALMFPIPSDSNYRVRAILNGHALKNLTVTGRSDVLAPDGPFLVLGNRLNVVELRMVPVGDGGTKNCTIWGFAAADMLGGRPVQGAAVYLNRGRDSLSFTDMAGTFEFQVPPGEVDLLAAFPGSYGHSAYDHSSGEWQVGDFTGTLVPGETRRVDLIFQKRNTEDASLAGRVVELSSGTGVADFHLTMRTSQSVMPEQVTGPGGLFHFTPLRDLTHPWRMSGALPGYNIVRVDRREVPEGPTTTGLDFPFDITIRASTLVWVDIYVEKASDEDLSKAVLWGKVTLSTSAGAPVEGAILGVSSSLWEQNVSDQDGMFSMKLEPGQCRLTALLVGMTSSFTHDSLTDSWSQGPWSGVLRAGEMRRVDIVIDRDDAGASSVAGRVMLASGAAPVEGFKLKMRSKTEELLPQVTVGGTFSFTPLKVTTDAWTLSGGSAEYTVSRVEYMVLPSAAPTVVGSLPVTFIVPQGSILWVDVFVNRTSSVKDGRITGQVISPFTYAPLEGVSVLVSSATDRTKTIQSSITGPDGTFELNMAAGDYVLRLVKEGHTEISFDLELGNAQELFQRFFMVPEAAKEGRSTLFSFFDSVKGTPVKELRVQIGGLGVFTTDKGGQLMVHLPFSGNYTFTAAGSIESIMSVSGANVTIGPDGTLHLVPGEEYIFKMRPLVQKGPDRGDGMSEPLLVGLIAGILVALFVGLIIGLLIARRPKEIAFFEE